MSGIEENNFFWFDGDAIHYDAPRYAKLRGITVGDAMTELEEILKQLLPGVPIEKRD
jgi:hypothetical protein